MWKTWEKEDKTFFREVDPSPRNFSKEIYHTFNYSTRLHLAWNDRFMYDNALVEESSGLKEHGISKRYNSYEHMKISTVCT
eukprot:snap_masked-scaffold_26-processed-gene-2.31-mRNA-1 protein AED:1.00 eAED:1.00 QI:0/0/0/0/1/1/2/0/80